MKTLILAALLCALLALDTAQGQCGDKPACPSGWTEYKDRCFFYVPKVTSWPDAQKNCQSLGGNLASVRDKDEYGAIQNVRLYVCASQPSYTMHAGTPYITTDYTSTTGGCLEQSTLGKGKLAGYLICSIVLLCVFWL
ncbi:lactose-binding lectin l-2-like [Mastacembelus armatus]|uniref:lactose-binding lectin l-2-like n=1 Tax=Mastacembelus armatus TaxID=205130 RepID=UPI000E45F252|nr:lactose-binding lectin l-2-like [Mastacembelus armatus]